MTTVTEPATSAKEQFILRFPHGMRAQLKELAASNRRSLNAQLLLLIERGMGASLAVNGDSRVEYAVATKSESEASMA